MSDPYIRELTGRIVNTEVKQLVERVRYSIPEATERDTLLEIQAHVTMQLRIKRNAIRRKAAAQ